MTTKKGTKRNPVRARTGPNSKSKRAVNRGRRKVAGRKMSSTELGNRLGRLEFSDPPLAGQERRSTNFKRGFKPSFSRRQGIKRKGK